MRLAAAVVLPALLLGSPLFAQEHDPHRGHSPSASAGSAEPTPAMDHAEDMHAGHTPDEPMPAMDHSEHEGHEAPAEADPGEAMDHSGMHGDHAGAGFDEIPQLPPPPEAFEGPLHAADAFLGAEVMRAAREEAAREMGGMPVYTLMAERLEYRARKGADGYLWDVQAYYGGDIDKLWLKGEGEGSFGENPESAEVQALWSHAVGPWWDLQLGLRQDLAGPDRTHAVIGVQGLAPYLFEIDAAAFLSHKGELTARIEAELDQRITQRLILQPRAEIALSAQDIPALGVGSGIDRIEAGLRLRYEIAREFAPYVGVEREWLLGGSADYARAAGDHTAATHFLVGLRFWF